jgi:hypothetical protein
MPDEDMKLLFKKALELWTESRVSFTLNGDGRGNGCQ